mmetsp:Transcript_25358/g.58980  ORF Transcript_25358/g.58980 Transcript_25358/m.58980 type:complete len:237 (-) Transcript_25358:1212-1922(-)
MMFRYGGAALIYVSVLARGFVVPRSSFAGVRRYQRTHLSVMEPIFTPKTDIPLNFGPASDRDAVLFTSERPGISDEPDSDSNPVSKEKVGEWIQFMKEKGIGHVMVLVDDNELEVFEDPGLLELYKEGGLNPHHTPMGEEGVYERIMSILKGIEAKNEKAVAHCTHGQGRSGRVAAAWIATRHNLSPEEATKVAVDTAIEKGVTRLGDVEKLEKWMGSEIPCTSRPNCLPQSHKSI